VLGDSMRRRGAKGGKAKPVVTASPRPRRRRRKTSWKRLLTLIPLAILLPFGIGYVVAVFVLFPPKEASGAAIPVPDLVGQTTAEAQRALAAAGLGGLEPTEMPHPSAPAGQVIAQSPLPGQQLHGGAAVRVALSAGRPRVVIPDVAGFAADRAEALLRGAGFDVAHAQQESLAAPGRVLRTEPYPGQSMQLPATVTLIVSSGPPAPVVVDSLLPDTLPPPLR